MFHNCTGFVVVKHVLYFAASLYAEVMLSHSTIFRNITLSNPFKRTLISNFVILIFKFNAASASFECLVATLFGCRCFGVFDSSVTRLRTIEIVKFVKVLFAAVRFHVPFFYFVVKVMWFPSNFQIFLEVFLNFN